MADNTLLNAGTGGDTVRNVDKSGIKTPVVLLDIGGTGAESLFTGQAKGYVDDAAHQFTVGETQPLSLTTDGRLRVATMNESYNYANWGDPERFGAPYSRKIFTAW